MSENFKFLKKNQKVTRKHKHAMMKESKTSSVEMTDLKNGKKVSDTKNHTSTEQHNSIYTCYGMLLIVGIPSVTIFLLVRIFLLDFTLTSLQ